jgi:hypothetical protein
MNSEFWGFEPLEGDFQSPSALLLHLNVFTVLSLFRVRGPSGFSDPPTMRTDSDDFGRSSMQSKDMN